MLAMLTRRNTTETSNRFQPLKEETEADDECRLCEGDLMSLESEIRSNNVNSVETVKTKEEEDGREPV